MNNSTKKKSLGSPPKQPVPLFFLYKSDKWEEVKKENPDLPPCSMAQIILNQWNTESQKIKDFYAKKHNKLLNEYEEAKKSYEEKFGKTNLEEKYFRERSLSANKNQQKKKERKKTKNKYKKQIKNKLK